MIDSAGDLYGTTELGGANNAIAGGDGTVFKLTRSSSGTYSESVLYSFAGGANDGDSPRGGVIADSSGDLFGTTEFGGQAVGSGYGTVFKLTPSPSGAYTETVLHSFAGDTVDGAYPLAGVIRDSSGNLYGTTQLGGANGEGTVFEIHH